MTNLRKNEAKGDINLFNFIKENRIYSKDWTVQKQNNKFIQEILDKTSKKGNGNKGYPDLIYVNENKKLLILIENKDQIKSHVSKNEDNPVDFAVDGIKHYLSFFTDDKLLEEKETIKKYFKDWKIIGIAFSGDINDEYNHRLDTYVIEGNNVKNINKNEILDEEDYLAFFENVDLEKIANDISKSSSEINTLLRNLDSQKRPVLLSALMVCLFEKPTFRNSFRENYSNYDTDYIISNIPLTVEKILKSENITQEKINVLINELAFMKTDKDLNDTDILKDILVELQDNVIPLFDKKTNYDIIGKFYEEFLRYAGITNVKKGIVLTPNHIATLFTELIDIKTDDIFFDPACGTGAFLIAGMNKLIDKINNSSLVDKQDRIKNIKKKQLIGFEKSSTMYSLAISNMLFRGDGKSQIFNEDFFSEESKKVLKNLKPTIGFVNPPYSGKDNKKNPTKKEIQFLELMLDNCSRYGIIIAPLSTFFKDENYRNRILTKHTLKYMINMPSDLFQPNASAPTAIAVFETNEPHGDNKVVFYDLKDDGFVLSKNKGRTDVFNKWGSVKKELLKKIKNPYENEDLLKLVYKKITGDDEWIIQAHSKNNYNDLNNVNFDKNLKKFLIFYFRHRLNLINKKIDEITLVDIFRKNGLSSNSILDNHLELNTDTWKEFSLTDVFSLSLGKPIHKIQIFESVDDGVTPYITRTAKNNGTELFLDSSNLGDKVSKGNCITIGAEGLKSFYQKEDFLTGNKINILRNKEINLHRALFICTVLDFIIEEKYTYGRAVVKNRLENEKIKLPVDKNGNPDWQFMEDYIKSLPYSSSL